VQLPLSWKAVPRVWIGDAKRAAKAYVKARPELEARVRRLLRKAPPAIAAKTAQAAADVTPSENSPSA
jgi:hypothetical protein